MPEQKLKQKKKEEKEEKKEMIIMVRPERQEKLKELFKDHIGTDEEISQTQIFKHLYGDPSNYSDIQIFYLWSMIKQDMNWLRKTTKYFIGSRHTELGWRYFIIKDASDAEFYKKTLGNTIKKCHYMIRRCEKAVRDQFWKGLDDK
jgi:hypothetical protein